MKTQSEDLFEKFLAANNLRFEKIGEVMEESAYRPDYLVTLSKAQLIFEVKELSKYSTPAGIGDRVRRCIADSKRQIQYGAKQGIPSVLLIHNKVDPTFGFGSEFGFGTDDLDFETAMYGQLTRHIDRNPGRTSEMFHGAEALFLENKNTSFSAVGRLCSRDDGTSITLSVTLFENAHAKLKVPFDQLPACFNMRRVNLSTETLRWSS